MQKVTIKFAFVLFAFLAFISTAHAATVSCNGSQSDCQSKVNWASDGDIITIPSGSHTWSTPVTWEDKNITIMGAGKSATAINVTNNYAFTVKANSKSSFRISGMKISSTDTNGEAVIRIKKDYAPAGYGWRIDNIDFVSTSASGTFSIAVLGITYGVIDNCTFTAEKSSVFIHLYGYVESDATFAGQAAWELPLTLGSNNAVYIENCTFNSTNQSEFLDVWMGSRAVVRYNNIANAFLTVHPAQSQWRAGHSVEVYNNVFNGSGMYRPSDIRGGTGVIFNNIVSGYQSNHFHIRNDRCTGVPGSYGYCNGSAIVDGNVAANGWPCQDQIGRTGGSLRSQTSEPYYAWSNGSVNLDGSVRLVLGNPAEVAWITTTGDATPHPGGVVDYINNGTTPKPGYVPFTYPHPLRGLTASSTTTTSTPDPVIADTTTAPTVTQVPTTTLIVKRDYRPGQLKKISR